MTLGMYGNRISMKFMLKVNVQDLNKESLIQWYPFKLYDEMITSLERRDYILRRLCPNEKLLNL